MPYKLSLFILHLFCLHTASFINGSHQISENRAEIDHLYRMGPILDLINNDNPSSQKTTPRKDLIVTSTEWDQKTLQQLFSQKTTWEQAIEQETTKTDVYPKKTALPVVVAVFKPQTTESNSEPMTEPANIQENAKNNIQSKLESPTKRVEKELQSKKFLANLVTSQTMILETNNNISTKKESRKQKEDRESQERQERNKIAAQRVQRAKEQALLKEKENREKTEKQKKKIQRKQELAQLQAQKDRDEKRKQEKATQAVKKAKEETKEHKLQQRKEEQEASIIRKQQDRVEKFNQHAITVQKEEEKNSERLYRQENEAWHKIITEMKKQRTEAETKERERIIIERNIKNKEAKRLEQAKTSSNNHLSSKKTADSLIALNYDSKLIPYNEKPYTNQAINDDEPAEETETNEASIIDIITSTQQKAMEIGLKGESLNMENLLSGLGNNCSLQVINDYLYRGHNPSLEDIILQSYKDGYNFFTKNSTKKK